MSVTNDKIVTEMEQIGCYNLKDNITIKLLDLCLFLGIDAEAIANEWCAFAHTKSYDLVPTVDRLEELERDLSSKKTNIRSIMKTPKQNKMVPQIYNAGTLDSTNILDTYATGTPRRTYPSNFTPSTPENQKLSKSSLKTSPFSPISGSQSPLGVTNCNFSARYKQRTSKGDVLCKTGSMIEKDSWKNTEKQTTKLSILPYDEKYCLKEKFGYMYSKQRDRCFILNDLIEEFEDTFMDKNNNLTVEIEELDHVRLPNPNEKHVVGRIFTDGETKMNLASIFLEGSYRTSSGQIIPMNIDSLQSYDFFPGQIIAATGLNTTGNQFFVNKVYPNIYPPAPDTKLVINNHLDLVVACGPFTTSDSLAYEPLTDLISYIKTHNPHICVLIGPFVDVKQENITQAFNLETAEELFDKQLNVIGDFLTVDGNTTKFVMISSHRDLHHDCVYPTPPYSPKLKNEHKTRFSFHSDPCILNINGIVIGITGVDVLFHLAKEELSHASPLNKMNRLLAVLLSQQSFYPLYPPNIDLCMDMEQFERYGKIRVTPHILITPSDLRCFVKNIENCCCINPERLAKGMVGGTFARIRVQQTQDDQTDPLINSITAEVVRI